MKFQFHTVIGVGCLRDDGQSLSRLSNKLKYLSTIWVSNGEHLVMMHFKSVSNFMKLSSSIFVLQCEKYFNLVWHWLLQFMSLKTTHFSCQNENYFKISFGLIKSQFRGGISCWIMKKLFKFNYAAPKHRRKLSMDKLHVGKNESKFTKTHLLR